LQGKEADPRSDIFAFGCVLYEVLSGKKAFSGSNCRERYCRYHGARTRTPSDITFARSGDQNLSRKGPDQRFQNARDLKRDLFWALEQAPETLIKRARASVEPSRS